MLSLWVVYILHTGKILFKKREFSVIKEWHLKILYIFIYFIHYILTPKPNLSLNIRKLKILTVRTPDVPLKGSVLVLITI